jgi:molybdenum cofactor biosynthesis protein B
MLSYQEIGAAAMLSRATAGLAGRTVIVALPGSEHAVRLAMEKLVIPELSHLVREALR